MPVQLADAAAVLVTESATQNYFTGGTFALGAGPFTDLSFTAEDDDTNFASFGAVFSESSGAGRQLGSLTDDAGNPVDSGVVSLQEVLTLRDPGTGVDILVGRVSMREDTGAGGGGSETQDFYIFGGPIDPSVAYDVINIDYTPGETEPNTYSYSDFSSSVVCFAAGTLLLTERGYRAVETIRPGERVQTADNGLPPVLWNGRQRFGRSELEAHPTLLPIAVAEGVLRNARPLLVSRQHRLLVGDRFVKAAHLVDVPGVRARVARGRRQIAYHHLLLDRHEVLFAEGCMAESLFIGELAARNLTLRMASTTARACHDWPAAKTELCRAIWRKKDLREHAPELFGLPRMQFPR